jgi:hypothetical protein
MISAAVIVLVDGHARRSGFNRYATEIGDEGIVWCVAMVGF